MLTAQQSSTRNTHSANTTKALGSAKNQPSLLSWRSVKWFFIWLLGVGVLSLASLNIYQHWIKAPQERLMQQTAQQHLQELSQVLNSHESQWRSSLEALANARLLIIAIAQKALANHRAAAEDQAPLRLSPSWIQALQDSLGANAEWQILLSPDALTTGSAKSDDAQSFSFTDQLLINGCFQGQSMPTEIYVQQGELLARQCHRVSMPVSQKLAAPTGFNPILFVRFPIAPTLFELQKAPSDFGELTWVQHFNDEEPEILLSHGTSSLKNNEPASANNLVNLSNPLWQLRFTYGSGFPKPPTNPIVLSVIAATLLFIFATFSQFCLKKGRPNHHKMARARFKQTVGFEENLSLIDLATEDIDWVTGGNLASQSSDTPAHKKGEQSDNSANATTHKRKKQKRVKAQAPSSPVTVSSTAALTQTEEHNPSEPADAVGATDTTGTPNKTGTPKTTETPNAQPIDQRLEPSTAISASRVPTTPSDAPFSPRIFRAYDIRGSKAEGIHTNLAYRLGVWLGQQSQTVYVGRDCRLSSPELYDAILQGLSLTNSHIEPLGIVTTPMLHFATALHPFWCLQKTNTSPDQPDTAFDINHYIKPHALSDDVSSVMVTASHNPKNDNGFKLSINGEVPTADALQDLYTALLTIEDNTAPSHPRSREPDTTLPSLSQHYIEAISERNACPETCRIVVDAGNGAASQIAPALFEEMGCEVIPLNCEFDGHFPNRTPDTSDDHQLASLITIVQELHADLGFALDGDGDRLAVVTASGQIIRADELLMLFTRDALSRNPGRDVVFDVKCSRNLVGIINQCGGRPVMSQTGNNHLRHKIQTRDAILGGDFSGHLYFTDQWVGSDDGLFAAARLLDILDQTQLSLDELVKALPHACSTPELRLAFPEEEKAPLLEQLVRSDAFAAGKMTTIDGVRVDYPKSWGLVRASNTSACLTMRFEGSSEAELARVQFYFKQALLAIKPDLELPF